MIGQIRGAIGQMEGLRYSLVKLPKSARKNILMDAMDDYLAELNNTLSNMDHSNKIVAANLLSDYQNNEAERHSVKERKKKSWGGLSVHGVIISKWDLATDWLTMTNDMFFEKYLINWVPSIKLQDDVKAFMNKYGNITEDDLKKPYGATERTKAPLQGESCITKPIRAEVQETFMRAETALKNTVTEIKEGYQILGTLFKGKINQERPTKEITENQISDIDNKLKKWTVDQKEQPLELTQNQLNTLGGLNTPNYNLYR